MFFYIRLPARAVDPPAGAGAVLVAHYYVDADLQDLAEETGGCVSDSLEMARFGRDHSAQTLVVSGVKFMGETSKIEWCDATFNPVIGCTKVSPACTNCYAEAYARQRLNGFVQNPAKHLQYAAKVLLKFKLLEARHLEMDALLAWARGTSYFATMLATHFAGQSFEAAASQLVHDLVRSGAATLQDGVVFDA